QARSNWWAYMVSGDAERLESFNSSAESVEQRLDQLLPRMEAPAQRARLLALQELVEDDLAKLRAVSLTRDPDAFEPNSELPYTMLTLFSRVRDLQSALVDTELHILRGRQAESDSAGTAIRGAIVVGYGLCLIVLALSLLYLHREAQARQRAQQEVLALNRALKERA